MILGIFIFLLISISISILSFNLYKIYKIHEDLTKISSGDMELTEELIEEPFIVF